MNKKQQLRGGIWIEKDSDAPEHNIIYSTWLREKKVNIVGFIPFEHPYEPGYLGSVGFIYISQFPGLCLRHNINKGLLQNHFYPLGGTAKDIRPRLLRKGLARRIELEIAKDLSKTFREDTLIAIGASSNSHLEYCHKLGIVPFEQIFLKEYLSILSHACESH